MKNKFFLTILFFHLAALVFARENSLCKISFEPSFGFMHGTIVENVWYVKETKKNNTITYTPADRMSRLDWAMNISPCWGLNCCLNFPRNIVVDFDFNCLITGDHGTMEDYDWLNPSTYAWRNDPPDELTNYSRHTNIIKTFTEAKFIAGYEFKLNTTLPCSITPLFGLFVQKCNFEGYGGYCIYKANNFEKKDFGQKVVINYKQTYTAPYFELKAYIDFSDFDASFSLFTAYSKQMNCVDVHKLRNSYFFDRLRDVWFFGTNFKFMYKIDSANKIGFKASMQFSPDTYGFTYSNPVSKKPLADSLGGSSRMLWNYALVYSITL